MQGRQLAVALFEHGEVHHPERFPALGHHAEIVADLHAQGPEGLVDYHGPVGAEEDDIAILCLQP